jgi:hypothetical protein
VAGSEIVHCLKSLESVAQQQPVTSQRLGGTLPLLPLTPYFEIDTCCCATTPYG